MDIGGRIVRQGRLDERFEGVLDDSPTWKTYVGARSCTWRRMECTTVRRCSTCCGGWV
jgi:hypothetical protein